MSSLPDLDIHITAKHNDSQPKPCYTCDKCDATFAAQYQLRQHVTKKHVANAQKNTTRIQHECEVCGQIFQNNEQVQSHKQSCEVGFQRPNINECNYYKRGNCLKGNNCRFKHTFNTATSADTSLMVFAASSILELESRNQNQVILKLM